MLIFRDKLPTQDRSAIINKINSISTYLGIDPNWLMAVMNFESGISHTIVNPISGATGLIQFMPTTAEGLGVSTSQLQAMGFLNQLEYVKRYYTPYKSRINGFQDLYLATFYPVAIGKPDNYVIGSTPERQSIIARQNPIFDPFKTGKVTVGAIKAALLAKVPTDYLKYVSGKTSTKIGVVGLLVVASIIYAFKTL